MIEVASPCVKVCRLDEAGDCQGCGRNRAEIAQWSTASDPEKAAILAAVAQRQACQN